MKARKKKGRKHDNIAIYSMFIMILILIILLIWGISKLVSKNTFTKISRTDDIVAKAKKDEEGVKTIAWVRVQGTNIDYPVIYAPNSDLSYMIEDFAWTEDEYKKLSDIVRLYGHNIKNLSANPEVGNPNHNRFEQLMSYTYYNFVKDNQFIQYTINGKDYIYRIYSVAYQEKTYLDIFSQYSSKNKNKLIKRSLKNSIYDFNVDVNNDDKLITLSTCTRMFASEDIDFVVTGRLLRPGEKTKLNKVKKTDNYKEVEKIMEGGDSNDEA